MIVVSDLANRKLLHVLCQPCIPALASLASHALDTSAVSTGKVRSQADLEASSQVEVSNQHGAFRVVVISPGEDPGTSKLTDLPPRASTGQVRCCLAACNRIMPGPSFGQETSGIAA